MPLLTYTLGRTRPALIASLPRNDPALAEAAVAGGADAIKTHIHVKHRASGTGFGSLAEERASLAAIRRAAPKLPVGVCIGDDNSLASRDELREIADLGLDFLDIYAHHHPVWMLEATRLEWMGALGADYVADEWSAVSDSYDVIEAAVLPHERYGSALTVRDLARYGRIAEEIDVPLVIPTQLAILPEEVPPLIALGVRGLMIGAIVTGKEPAGYEQACRDFRAVLDTCTITEWSE